MNSGLQELGLALFTTLSPSSIVAVAVVALAIALIPSQDKRWLPLANRIIILLAFALLGFLASAGQLGSPDNALFVFTGIGRSPLSNEVASVVVFSGLAGLFWLASFYNLPQPLRRIWAVAIVLAACVAAAMISQAYSAPTILTWDSVFVPINLLLSALVGGLTMGGLYLRLNGGAEYGLCQKVLCALAALLLGANVVVLVHQNQSFAYLGNSFVEAADVMSGYPVSIALYCILVVVGIVLSLLLVRRATSNRSTIAIGALASLPIFVGIFVIRLAFYAMYMTVGL